MNEIKTETYQIHHDSDKHVITFSGVLRLQTAAYQPISDLLNQAAALEPGCLTLDLYNLKMLNSAGINTLTKFLIQLRNQKAGQIQVRGNQGVSWQRKSLRNLQRLMSGIDFDLVWED